MLENEIPQENVVLRWSYRERRSKKTKDSIRTKCWEKKTVNVLDVRQHKSKLSLNFQRTLLSSITIVLNFPLAINIYRDNKIFIRK